MNKLIITFAVFILILLLGNISEAETVRRGDGNQAAMAKAQLMMRQMQAENNALKNTNETLKTQLDAIEKKISSLKKTKETLNKKLKTSTKINTRFKENTEVLQQRIMKDRERMRELIAKFKELLQLFRGVEQEKAQLTVNLAENKADLLHCAENNMKLVDTNRELVEQYVNKGLWQALRQAEPITQLKQVEIENIAQEYKGTIEVLKISDNKN